MIQILLSFRFAIMTLIVLVIINIHSSNGDEQLNAKLTNAFRAIGRIYKLDTETRVGSAFVAGKNHNVFTAAHVGIADTLSFLPYKSDYFYKVVLKYQLKGLDLAIYSRTAGKQTYSLPIGNFKKVTPGDTVYYFGWEKENVLICQPTIVSAVGSALNYDEVINFLDFEGPGVPGYSGGPVLNTEGEVIAMIVQGWDYKPIQKDTVIRILRAYSIDFLRIIEKELKTSTDKQTNSDDEGLRIIDLFRQED